MFNGEMQEGVLLTHEGTFLGYAPDEESAIADAQSITERSGLTVTLVYYTVLGEMTMKPAHAEMVYAGVPDTCCVDLDTKCEDCPYLHNCHEQCEE